MLGPPLTRDFFISRTGADKEWALWISQELEAASYTTFLQDRDFLPGDSFVARMQEGAECDCTILVMSPDYWKAAFTAPEWQAAFKRRRFLPILVKRCDVPALLSHYVWIDLVDKTRDEARQLLLEGVKRERRNHKVEFPGEAGDPKVSIAKLPTVNSLLIGREAGLKKLDEAWENPKTNLVSIVAFGGVGKTSLAINWWHRNQAPGARRILGWSFYSQGAAEDRQASAEPFLDHALREWFGVTDPPKDSWTRGEKLAELIRRERTLLILDGLEPIQFPPGPQVGHFKDPGMEALLRELSIHNPGLCVCTSRLSLTDLDGPGTLTIDLDNLTRESGAEYLKTLGVQGPDEELQRASQDFDNHALALTLLGNLLVKRYHGDIYKRDTIPTVLDEHKQGAHARRILRQYEHLFKDKPELDVLRILGLFDRPADKGALKILRKLSARAWAEALENLKDARLVEYEDLDGPLDCHPLIREHFAEEYRTSKPEEFRAAQAQLYEYYSKLAPELPDTLEGMEPLFHAVYHGCQAGRHLEALDVLPEHILHGGDYFLVNKLGAFGVDLSLLANFLFTAWSKPVPSLSAFDQSWVTAAAAFALRSLGRLREAVEPTRAAADGALWQQHLKNLSIGLGNLSEIYLTLGDVGEAINTARGSVEAADRSGDGFERLSERTTLADALHQSGDLAEASKLFQEAEKMQAEWQPELPALYSVQGYRYRDLLLAQCESEDVLRRATQTLGLSGLTTTPLISAALDHLSLGRAHPFGSAEAADHLNQAVGGLRRAGTLDMLPLGLLARAAHFRHTHEWEKAQHDLEEVRVLATRCGMRLHLTDYHLEQARALLAQGKPTEAIPHYEAAKKLIEETGYHRRDAELAELAKALA